MMFSDPTKGYMTRAIAEELHPEIQVILWRLIDQQRKEGEELDYLQVFELTVHNDKQAILHRQEQPPREAKWLISMENAQPIKTKIWCIDDGENQMMLYPSDY